MRAPRLALLLLLLVSLLAAGCGSDDEGSSDSGGGSADTAADTQATTQTGPPTVDSSLKNTKVKPVIDKPTGSPPSKLVKEDIVKGKGRAAKSGDTVSVQYVGVNFSNGQEFDASWDRGQAFSFPLGAGQVIEGWDKGVAGMKVGGRRQLTIPPELGYGSAGSPPAIPPNETLVFVVDLQAIQ